jgi:hypothetical protein
MKKIPSLFKRDYDGNRQVFDAVVPGCEWVQRGEGVATEKIDGTACLIQDGILYKRYDRKKGKPAPDGWIAAEPEPNEHTGHWPGWVPVGEGNEDRWHRDAFARLTAHLLNRIDVPNGTYELVGPKVRSNPHRLGHHMLVTHGAYVLDDVPTTFDALREYLTQHDRIEGIVWHHPDGRMCKIKRRDFGLPWPIKE